LTGKQNFTHDGWFYRWFDNPKDNTAVIIKDQFQEDITSEQNTANFIAWKKLSLV
jgi:hypothetical protein